MSSPSLSSNHDDLWKDDYNRRMMSNSRSLGGGDGVISEIEEEEEELFEIEERLDTIREEGGMMEGSSLFSFDFHNGEGEDAVYVAIAGNYNYESSSMDALLWTLNHALNNHPHPHPSSSTSTIVFLVHVFPEIKHIPTPLGMMPVSQANPEQKENYMAQERGKRREFLDKFLSACSTAQVKVDTILIESDMEAKAILDLIPILNIRKLVLGTTKANLRKMRSRRASGMIGQILKDAPEFCEVKIICEGKEILDLLTDSPSPSPRAYSLSPQPIQQRQQQQDDYQEDHHVTSDSFTCGCFKPKVHS
ncbi:hypothetical protein ACH5RR_014637 [Cinchona calisaya]|uniref:Uncharacterized protein n=1 Tax=Cinchona calisaya TaxID=153742 RepID=A0ABD2ZR98_9GENT